MASNHHSSIHIEDNTAPVAVAATADSLSTAEAGNSADSDCKADLSNSSANSLERKNSTRDYPYTAIVYCRNFHPDSQTTCGVDEMK